MKTEKQQPKIHEDEAI